MNAGEREAYRQVKLDALFQFWLVRACAWGAALFLMLSALDYVAAHAYFQLFLVYRISGACVLLLSSFAVAKMRSRSVRYLLAYAAVGVSAAIIELMILRFGGHASPYYVGMILLAVAVVGFIPARMPFHVFLVLLIYGIYFIPIVATERITDMQAFFTANAFMTMIFMTALIMRFMSSRNLIKQLDLGFDLEQANRRLEEAVRDRTNELSLAVQRLRQEMVGHRRAEERLHDYAEELKETNEELRAVVYSISHDLRAPLVNIRGFSGELAGILQNISAALSGPGVHLSNERQAHLQSMIEHEVPASLGFIKTATDRMQSLIDAYLKLSRITRRKLVLELIDMEDLVGSQFRLHSKKIEENNITVSFGVLPRIVADCIAMEQIFSCLLDNAIKYLDPVSNGTIAVTALRLGEEVVFRVSDNGRGIAREDLHKVFEVFRRSGKQDVPGEGMGLPYVKTLVRRHGGRIWCESEPGKGTTISFTIPHVTGALIA